MYKCLGLGDVNSGCCGEDWYHAACLVGLDGEWQAKEAAEDEDSPPPPPRFPHEDDFEGFICFKCVEANPWIKRYAGTDGFLPPVYQTQDAADTAAQKETTEEIAPKSEAETTNTLKRKAPSDSHDEQEEADWVIVSHKKVKSENQEADSALLATDMSTTCKHKTLPPALAGSFSLFFKDNFRDSFCRCASCFRHLSSNPQLLEQEESYEPPLDKSSDGAGSTLGTGSMLDRGERALNNIDRVRAIEGVMVYNHLKEKVKDFLKPFAESGNAVGAEDIKAYFESLRGDQEGIKEAQEAAKQDEDNRKEQGG
jgi:E3 ubiquitin-protein ligase UBR7